MKDASCYFIIMFLALTLCWTSNIFAQQLGNPIISSQRGAPPIIGVPPAGVPGGIAPPPPPGPPQAPPTGPVPGIATSFPIQTILANLQQATNTAQSTLKLITPGKVWISRAPAGEIEIKAGILYQGVVIGVIRFNPLDGRLLPMGINAHLFQTSIDINTIKAKLPEIIKSLQILPAAKFLEPELSWAFPVAYNNIIVTELKIYYDGIHVVPDYPADQEMRYLAQ